MPKICFCQISADINLRLIQSLQTTCSLNYNTIQDIMEITIPDQTTSIQPTFNELQNNFKLNLTQNLQFREKSLEQLIKGYQELQSEIDQALKHDIGYNPFMSNFVAHTITLNEIKDLKNNFKTWALPKSTKTPIVLGLASCEVIYEPLGVALVLSAWNYPIYTALPQVAAAIAAGNCVILKPSQFAPHTSKVLKKLFEKYLDPKCFRVIEGRVEVAKTLTRLKFDIICFTGSTQTGRLVAIEAAKNLTPCILELGGKCPVIIDQTADLQSAALRIIFGKYINSGQTCVAVDHVFVQQKVYQKFKAVLLAQIKKAFDHQDNSTSGDYGKINNKNHLNKLKKLLQNHGGSQIYGGKILEEKLHFPPTIIEKPSKDSLLMKEQIFGPILPIHSYSNLKDLVNQIRNKPKPLVMYVFSQNNANIDFVKNNTSSGSFVVNDAVVQMLNCHLPFGGVGASGYGRYHGQSGFLGFSNPKSVCYTKAFNAYPLSTRFFPYDDSKKRVLSFLFKVGDVTYTQLKKGSVVLALIIAGAAGYLKMRPYL